MTETIYLGGGCFWCTEAIFQSLRGVTSVTSGYAGGTIPYPSYEQVCQGETGHAEVIKIDFDTEVISLTDLLDVFFELHDPTSIDRQGADVGSQYRSLVIYTAEMQKEVIQEAKDKIPGAVTEIKPFVNFYPAENYHQNYYSSDPQKPYCQLIISPKLTKLRQKFSPFIKN